MYFFLILAQTNLHVEHRCLTRNYIDTTNTTKVEPF